MHIRDQKTQITFMDKNIDLIINSKFIGSQQTHRKKSLHQIDLQEHRGEHCIENQKERHAPPNSETGVREFIDTGFCPHAAEITNKPYGTKEVENINEEVVQSLRKGDKRKEE